MKYSREHVVGRYTNYGRRTHVSQLIVVGSWSEKPLNARALPRIFMCDRTPLIDRVLRDILLASVRVVLAPSPQQHAIRSTI